MKNVFFALVAIAAFTLAAHAQQLAWTDTNSASASVMRYVVYDYTTSDVYKMLDLPKTTDEPKDVTIPIDVSAAGRVFAVTAVNGMGLESLPSNSLRVPDVAVPPVQIRLAFDLTNRKTLVLWEDPNPPEAEVKGFSLFIRTGTGNWTPISQTSNTVDRITITTPSELATFRMTARNFWGESEFSEEISTPTVVVPVTSLRLIGVVE